MSINEKIENLKGKLIVSCQARAVTFPFYYGKNGISRKDWWSQWNPC